MENNNCTCSNCRFWIKEYQSCFNGKSKYCAEFTKPDQTCISWKDKESKEKIRSYERRKKGGYLSNG